MADSRKAHLDALERRLTGPKRLALFGHRHVGKTTLLAMFYRQASTGRVPQVRLAAMGAASSEYLAEKIAQIESGQPIAGTLAETELSLRLYHGPARLDLIVKDYQGEHVALGSEESIFEFFAGCDAVLLCLDPTAAADPADRRRRQQEVERLLEHYIERSDDLTTDRPVALLITKFDRVQEEAIGADSPNLDPARRAEQVAESLFGMTCHALASHAPKSAIFAVSAYGRGAVDGRPPAELHPFGLEGPLTWVAEQLEARDLDQLEWLWDLAPNDLPRLSRCVRAYDQRYPRSPHALVFRKRLKSLRRERFKRSLARLAAASMLLVACLAGYDAWGYRAAAAFERDNPAPAVARRWANTMIWHPTMPLFWPTNARDARLRRAEWTVKAAEVQVANGTESPQLADSLRSLKDQEPSLAPAIAKVEAEQDKKRHDERWRSLKGEAAIVQERPEATLEAVRDFLRAYPETSHRTEALAMATSLEGQVAAKRTRAERQIVDDLVRAEGLPGADLRDLIEQARQFLAEHPESEYRAEVDRRLSEYTHKLDERDIERARQYSRQYPTNFATRIDRYQDYLKAHQTGGRFISEATEAKDQILREWDKYAYRLAYDHSVAHPDDVAEVARLLRSYLQAHPQGRFERDARDYLEWWSKVSVPGEYRIILRRGEVEPDVGKYLGGGGPDLCVELWVAGVKYGPSPAIPNTHRPIWDYPFAKPVKWKLGDPVVVRIIDRDWSDSVVYTLQSKKGDPLAIRLISGAIRPARGGHTSLVFASNFRMPTLSRPD